MGKLLKNFGKELSDLVRNPFSTGLILFLLNSNPVGLEDRENYSNKTLAREVAENLLKTEVSLNGIYGISLINNFGYIPGIHEIVVNYQDLNKDNRVGYEDNLIVTLKGTGVVYGDDKEEGQIQFRKITIYDDGIDGEPDDQKFLIDGQIIKYIEFEETERYKQSLLIINDHLK